MQVATNRFARHVPDKECRVTENEFTIVTELCVNANWVNRDNLSLLHNSRMTRALSKIYGWTRLIY